MVHNRDIHDNLVQTGGFFYGSGESSCGGRMEVYIAPVMYCLSTVGGERSVSCLSHFTHMRLAPGTHSKVGWVGPGATLDALG